MLGPVSCVEKRRNRPRARLQSWPSDSSRLVPNRQAAGTLTLVVKRSSFVVGVADYGQLAARMQVAWRPVRVRARPYIPFSCRSAVEPDMFGIVYSSNRNRRARPWSLILPIESWPTPLAGMPCFVAIDAIRVERRQRSLAVASSVRLVLAWASFVADLPIELGATDAYAEARSSCAGAS